MSGMTWGAYPGEPLNNVESGRGIVRNSYALNGVEKSVLRSPFVSKSQLVVNENGRIAMTPAQFRAIRQVVLRPGLSPILAMIREMATPENSSGQSFLQKCTVGMIQMMEGLFSLFGALGPRSK